MRHAAQRRTDSGVRLADDAGTGAGPGRRIDRALQRPHCRGDAVACRTKVQHVEIARPAGRSLRGKRPRERDVSENAKGGQRTADFRRSRREHTDMGISPAL